MRVPIVIAAAVLAGCAAPGVDPKLTEAIGWYTGMAGHVDDALARTLLLEAASDRDPLSQMWIARVHSTGRMGFPADTAEARRIAETVVKKVERMAEGNEPEAMFLMGTAYAEGLGKPTDPSNAFAWYRRAADAGHVLAMHNLGNAYRDGAGVDHNDSLAVVWWTRAASEGDAIPALRLGESYEMGRGVPADLAEAQRWYNTAAARGLSDAFLALARLNQQRVQEQMLDVGRRATEARRRFEGRE